MNDQLLQEMLDKSATKAIDEYQKSHHCMLTETQIRDLQLVSGFLTRFRNAVGNAVMVFIFILIFAVIGLVTWAVTLGKINPLKMLGM